MRHVILISVAILLHSPQSASATKETNDNFVGSKICATCHPGIYEQYSKTPMARSSGVAQSVALDAISKTSHFTHINSATEYSVSKTNNDRYHLDFWKLGTNSEPIQGRRRLEYFIGSGAAARGFIFSMNGYLFQSPIAYYSAPKKWDMAPGYEGSTGIFLSRAVERNCLECHASWVQLIEGTENRYASPPFREAGVACERCHGPGGQHVLQKNSSVGRIGSGIINPIRLNYRERDSICAQCHLTGEVRVSKQRTGQQTFRPGDLLTNHVVPFIWASDESPDVKVIGHFERLWRSQCKKKSGDHLWCGSCHDSHLTLSADQRTGHFRGKCLGCHKQLDCKESETQRLQHSDDCVRCHMPKIDARDGGHSAFTDHWISKFKRNKPAATTDRELVPFWENTATSRDLALAYSKVAEEQDIPALRNRAFTLLKDLVDRGERDGEVALQLGVLYDRKGDSTRAGQLYRKALLEHPGLLVAQVNLAAKLAEVGQLRGAIGLWDLALQRNPGLEVPRVNLAKAYLQLGDIQSAKDALDLVLSFNPDSRLAHLLMESRLREK